MLVSSSISSAGDISAGGGWPKDRKYRILFPGGPKYTVVPCERRRTLSKSKRAFVEG